VRADSATTGVLPVVAVVGRPNVGKSSLVNRILGRREAIVEATPGVTRDRRAFVAEWSGREFEVLDTGGLVTHRGPLEDRIREQAALAIDAADVIVLVVDAVTGPDQDDIRVADELRRSGKPVVLAANKIDDPADEPAAATFYRLGLGDPVAVSALHGRGSGDLLEAVVTQLPEARAEPSGAWASVAIVGRPNVGKSSILNALLDETRSIVDEAPGTTRDPIDSYLEGPDGRVLRIVDTAGMRRRTRIQDPVEYFSWLRARGTLRRIDAALIVADVSEGVTGHDQRVAEEVLEHGRACVVVLNKWDLVGALDGGDRERLERDTATKLRFLPWATRVRTSAVGGRGIDKLWTAVVAAVESHRRRLPTPLVNRTILAAQDHRPHPRSAGGRPARVLYATQSGVSPPTFLLFATGRLEASYLRYLERRLREAEPFGGSPLRLEVRQRPRREVEG
jgi:GTPase